MMCTFHNINIIWPTRSAPDPHQIRTRSAPDPHQIRTRSAPDPHQIRTRSAPDPHQIRTGSNTINQIVISGATHLLHIKTTFILSKAVLCLLNHNVDQYNLHTHMYSSSSFVLSNRILPFVYTFSSIFV